MTSEHKEATWVTQFNRATDACTQLYSVHVIIGRSAPLLYKAYECCVHHVSTHYVQACKYILHASPDCPYK